MYQREREKRQTVPPPAHIGAESSKDTRMFANSFWQLLIEAFFLVFTLTSRISFSQSHFKNIAIKL